MGPILDRDTFGSSPSNRLCLLDKSVRPLQGQFLLRARGLFYRDFHERREIEIAVGESLRLAGWDVFLENPSNLLSRYQSEVLSSFKEILKELPSEDLNLARERLRLKWFLTPAIPDIFSTLLQTQVRQISLESPIEYLLRDDDVTDILVQRFDQIWVERSGRLVPSGLGFLSEETFHIYLENLMTKLHKTIDEALPFLDFTMPDGSRGHLIVPPLTDGARYLSIRKMKHKQFSLEDLVQRRMLSHELHDVLMRAVCQKNNILISGATGSGKTTLMKALLSRIPESERLLVVEDTPELKVERANAVFLRTRRGGRNDMGEIDLRELLRQALRMRPDRIVLGEVRGPEALDLVHAMNTGHQGCMGSLHANSCRDALGRLQGLIQMASARLSEMAMSELIGRNLHLVIQCGRDSNGLRRILEYARVRGVDQGRILLEVKECTDV